MVPEPVDVIAVAEEELARLEEDVLFSEKQHFSMVTTWSWIHYVLGIPGALAAGLAGVAVVQNWNALAVGCAAIAAVMTSLMTFLNCEKKKEDHLIAGNKYSSLRGRLRRMRRLELTQGMPIDVATPKLQQMSEEKTVIQHAAPHIGGIAYWLAKRSIGKGEHAYEVDEKRLGDQ